MRMSHWREDYDLSAKEAQPMLLVVAILLAQATPILSWEGLDRPHEDGRWLCWTYSVGQHGTQIDDPSPSTSPWTACWNLHAVAGAHCEKLDPPPDGNSGALRSHVCARRRDTSRRAG